MKLLESGRLEALSSALSILNGDSAVQSRVESYSCKMAGTEKAFYKRFTADGETSRDLQALSPPEGVLYRYTFIWIGLNLFLQSYANIHQLICFVLLICNM